MLARPRWMINRDLPNLGLQENGVEHVRSLLRQRNIIGMVVESAERAGRGWETDDGKIMAWMIYRLHSDSIEILEFCGASVLAKAALFRRLRGKLNPERRERVEWRVEGGDLPTHLMLRAWGWFGWPAPHEDAIDFTYSPAQGDTHESRDQLDDAASRDAHHAGERDG